MLAMAEMSFLKRLLPAATCWCWVGEREGGRGARERRGEVQPSLSTAIFFQTAVGLGEASHHRSARSVPPARGPSVDERARAPLSDARARPGIEEMGAWGGGHGKSATVSLSLSNSSLFVFPRPSTLALHPSPLWMRAFVRRETRPVPERPPPRARPRAPRASWRLGVSERGVRCSSSFLRLSVEGRKKQKVPAVGAFRSKGFDRGWCLMCYVCVCVFPTITLRGCRGSSSRGAPDGFVLLLSLIAGCLAAGRPVSFFVPMPPWFFSPSPSLPQEKAGGGKLSSPPSSNAGCSPRRSARAPRAPVGMALQRPGGGQNPSALTFFRAGGGGKRVAAAAGRPSGGVAVRPPARGLFAPLSSPCSSSSILSQTLLKLAVVPSLPPSPFPTAARPKQP